MTSKPPDGPVPAELASTVDELGIHGAKELRRSDKTLLAAGLLEGEPVVVKLLLDDDPFWRAKWRHEIAVYQTFADHPPPIRAPRLIHTDASRVLVLESIAGRPLDAQRYPDRPLDPHALDTVLSALRALNAWAPPPGRFAPIFDYPDRIARYHQAGFLTDEDSEALGRLLAGCGEPAQLNHGDPLPSNLLLTNGPDRECALVDWEFTGLFLPGFDLAMLRTLLARTPAAQARIDTLVAADHAEEPFLVNLACVLTRELRIHRELPDGPLRSARLALIEPVWAEARDRLHAIA